MNKFETSNFSSGRVAQLMIDACGTSTINAGAQAAIQALQVIAANNASGLRLRRFSALSDDETRLYIRIKDGNSLRITADAISPVANGTDSFWLEHPNGGPLEYSEGDGAERLSHFERLHRRHAVASRPASLP